MLYFTMRTCVPTTWTSIFNRATYQCLKREWRAGQVKPLTCRSQDGKFLQDPGVCLANYMHLNAEQLNARQHSLDKPNLSSCEDALAFLPEPALLSITGTLPGQAGGGPVAALVQRRLPLRALNGCTGSALYAEAFQC